MPIYPDQLPILYSVSSNMYAVTGKPFASKGYRTPPGDLWKANSSLNFFGYNISLSDYIKADVSFDCDEMTVHGDFIATSYDKYEKAVIGLSADFYVEEREVDVKVPLDVVKFDVKGGWVSGSHTYVVSDPGIYMLSGSVSLNVNNGRGNIFKVSVQAQTQGQGFVEYNYVFRDYFIDSAGYINKATLWDQISIPFSVLQRFHAGDSVALFFRQQGTNTYSVDIRDETFFSIVRLK